MYVTTESRNTMIHSYLSPKARLEERGITGKGIFAAEAIAKNEVVAMWGGSIMSAEEMHSLSESLRQYAIRIEENLWIGPRSFDAIDDTVQINHSCEPNCGVHGQIAIVAMRNIAPGEELTFDYAMTEPEDGSFSCTCNTASCRGGLHAQDHNSLDLREKYRGYFSSYLERLHGSMVDDEEFLNRFNATGAWGLVTALDLHDCNPATIRSAEKIREFTIEVCERIKVNRFGEPTIVHFGADEKVAGYSLVQLIETSLVSGHFANLTNRAYIDVFSCAYYNPTEAARFAAEFFEARSFTMNTYLRH